MTVRKPSPEQIAVAVDWLRLNEGTECGERDACYAIAAWVEHLQAEADLRAVARAAGVPVSRARIAIDNLTKS